MVHIQNISKISQFADEILYLQKSCVDLKELTSHYITIIKSNNETIKFYPAIEAELRNSLEKKNFNIANAQEKIDKLNGALKKIVYIKQSISSYKTITDSVIRQKSDIDNFKQKIIAQIQQVKLEDVDSVYNQVISKYNEFNQQTIYVGDIRGKYAKLKQVIDSNKGTINRFPKVENELTDFIVAMGLDDFKADYYLKSVNEVLAKLDNIKDNVNALNRISKEDSLAIDAETINNIHKIPNSVVYDSVIQTADISRKNIEAINATLNKLQNIRSYFKQLLINLQSNKNYIFTEDFTIVNQKINQIEPLIYSKLNPNFLSVESQLKQIDNQIKLHISDFNTKKSEAQNLLQKLNANKTRYWLEDYNAILSKIQNLKNGQKSENFRNIDNEISTKQQVKSNEIDIFSRQNLYLLDASGQLSILESNYTNSLVTKSDFEKFASSFQKNGTLKKLGYKIKDIVTALVKFLLKPKTLKFIGIVIAIGIGIYFVMSYWHVILIVGIIAIIIFGLLKK
jgi:hypothetical protein